MEDGSLQLLKEGGKYMSLKHKIWLSYIVMIFVPVFLSIQAARLILINYEQDYQIQMEENHFDDKLNEGFDYFYELEKTLKEKPDRLDDYTYLSRLDQKRSLMDIGIIVRKGNELIYHSDRINMKTVNLYLPEFKNKPDTEKTMISMQDKILMRSETFFFSDGTEGHIYNVMSKANPFGKETIASNHRGYVKTIFLIFVAFIWLTNGILTYFMSKNIINPLKSLQKATNEIAIGNFNFPVKINLKDEIGELFESFETMRVQLKASQGIKQQYEKNRKELISNISHDLKTPITSIKGYVEGIMDGIPDTPEKMEKYIKTIYKNSCEMDRLIDDLFLFSKLDIKQLPFDFEEINIHKYLEDCIEEMTFDLAEKDIKLSYESSYNCVGNLIIADRQRLKRVINNIIGNTEKHMDKEQPEIKLILVEEKEGVRIEIRDNGHGIPIEKISYIFERFYRADYARNRATGGSGLGLSIAKQIIDAHQGEIWAESKEDIGTSIFFTLKNAESFNADEDRYKYKSKIMEEKA